MLEHLLRILKNLNFASMAGDCLVVGLRILLRRLHQPTPRNDDAKVRWLVSAVQLL